MNIKEVSGKFPVKDRPCTFCVEVATSVWHGAETIYACPDCAVEVAPTMAADAIDASTADAVKRAAREMTLTYWRALALRLIGGGK